MVLSLPSYLMIEFWALWVMPLPGSSMEMVSAYLCQVSCSLMY